MGARGHASVPRVLDGLAVAVGALNLTAMQHDSLVNNILGWWLCRAGTLQRVTARAASRSTAPSSRTRASASSTTHQAFSAWQTQGRTPMARSSSSAQCLAHGWTTSTVSAGSAAVGSTPPPEPATQPDTRLCTEVMHACMHVMPLRAHRKKSCVYRACRPCGPPAAAVVFGRVVEGMTIVKRMEMCGQRSGKTSRRVIIADCGQVSGACAGQAHATTCGSLGKGTHNAHTA